MRIFDRSHIREFSAVSLAVTGVLTAIMLTQQLVRLLTRAARGLVDPEAVTAILGFTIVSILPVLLGIAMFVAVLQTLTRSYRDSEMTIWFASGIPLTRWALPVLRFAVPVVVLIAAMSLWVAPWSNTQMEEYRRIMESRDLSAFIKPGRFTEIRSEDQVFFIDNISDAADGFSNVFAQSRHGTRIGVVVAKRGYFTQGPEGNTQAVLEEGRRYEGTPGGLDYQEIDFQRLTYELPLREVEQGKPALRAYTTMALASAGTPEAWAELHWRIALPISALLMAMLAIPLAFVNPRSGRWWNLIMALLIWVLYYNSLTIAQTMVVRGQLPTWLGLWPVHGVMLLIIAALFWKRLASFRWAWLARR